MHKLRKTYASYLLANGVEEKIAQSQLRHKDSATTHKHYEFSIRNREYKSVNTADYFPITDDIARPQTVDYNCP